jgi:hypothetical protein
LVVAFTAALNVFVPAGRVAVTTCARAGSVAVTGLRARSDIRRWREVRIVFLPRVQKFN